MSEQSDFAKLRNLVKILKRGEELPEGEYAVALIPAHLTDGNVDTFGWLKKKAGPTKPDAFPVFDLQSSDADCKKSDVTTYGWLKKQAPKVEI